MLLVSTRRPRHTPPLPPAPPAGPSLTPAPRTYLPLPRNCTCLRLHFLINHECNPSPFIIPQSIYQRLASLHNLDPSLNPYGYIAVAHYSTGVSRLLKRAELQAVVSPSTPALDPRPPPCPPPFPPLCASVAGVLDLADRGWQGPQTKPTPSHSSPFPDACP